MDRAQGSSIDTNGLLKEARLLQQLDHPHIVRYVASCEFDDGDMLGIVMELLVGGSLQAKIATPPPPTEDVAEWLRQIASGIAHMHSLKMQHRDLKPAHVRRFHMHPRHLCL